jgi:hypothetical protein
MEKVLEDPVIKDSLIRERLCKIIEDGEFPDDSFEIRHLRKVSEFERIGKNKVRFRIERHPHLFHRTSLGRPSSAYVPTVCIYEFDLRNNKVIDVEAKELDPVIDYEMLAEDEIDWWKEWFSYKSNVNDPDDDKTKEEAIKKAKKVFEKIDWLSSLVSDHELPNDFGEKLLTELWKQFIPVFLEEWKQYLEEITEGEEQNAVSQVKLDKM